MTSACGILNLISFFRRTRLDLLDPQDLKSAKFSIFYSFQFRVKKIRWLNQSVILVRNPTVEFQSILENLTLKHSSPIT